MKHRHTFEWDKKKKRYWCKSCGRVLAIWVTAPNYTHQDKSYGFVSGEQ